MKTEIITNESVGMNSKKYITPSMMVHPLSTIKMIAQTLAVGIKDGNGNEITVGADESLVKENVTSPSGTGVWDDEW